MIVCHMSDFAAAAGERYCAMVENEDYQHACLRWLFSCLHFHGFVTLVASAAAAAAFLRRRRHDAARYYDYAERHDMLTALMRYIHADYATPR